MNFEERPNGKTVHFIGIILITFGIFFAFIGVSAAEPWNAIYLFVLSGAAVNIGVLLLSLGYLVRAIYFLPGREIQAEYEEDALSSPEEAGLECEWCGQVAYSPNKPCSMLAEERLLEIASDIENRKCQLMLVDRGYLAEE